MTLDRIDEELTLLRTITDGDGEFVDLDGLPERSVNILKDLEREGYVSGQIMLDGSARLRITAAGDRYFDEEFQKRLDYENASYASERAIPQKISASFMEKFGWPVLVGVTLVVATAVVGLIL